ncbi:hypothetical protein RBG11_004265 [Vibrio parahaemolyticus]|nr:hypothetical protein [Vibrio parahaemolyticus]
MTDIVGVVSFNSLRAVLGVDTEDLSDAVIVYFELEPSINVDMSLWFTQWKELRDKVSKTDAEVLQFDALKTYLKYFCAYEVIISANFQFLQRKSDGEVESHRFKEDALLTLKNEYLARMEKAKANVLAVDTDFTPDASTGRFTLLRRGSPNTDVVTD